jgi:hypothetical protein
MMSTLQNRFDAAGRGVRGAFASALSGLRTLLSGLRTLLIGRDDRGTGRRRPLAWTLATLGAAYLAYGGTTYLHAKSGLPLWLCAIGGAALASPLVLVVARPLMAWRVGLLAALVTGAAVQAHERTPFSWHPAMLVALVVVLCVVVRRHRPAVGVWAWASMAALIAVSFYPADRLPLIALVTVPAAVAAFATRRQPKGNRTAAGVR